MANLLVAIPLAPMGSALGAAEGAVGSLVVSDEEILEVGGVGLGSLAIEGDLTMEAGGTVVVEIDAISRQHDVVTVSGGISYGGVLRIRPINGAFVGGESFRIMEADHVSGQFEGLAGSPGPGLCWIFDPETGVLRVSNPSPPAVIDALPEIELHVSPMGDDSDAGSLSAPLATLERARDVIRSARSVGRGGLAVVWVHEGEYDYSAHPLDFGANDYNTVYRAVPGESFPRLNGGKLLDPTWFTVVGESSPIWSRLDENAKGKVLEVDLAARGIFQYGALGDLDFGTAAGSGPMELFVDDAAMQLARYPNGDTFAYVAKVNNSTTFTYAGDRPSRWETVRDVWVHGWWYHHWADYARQVISIDTEKRLVSIGRPPSNYGMLAGQPYFFLNILEELDSPGEYYLDRNSGRLYFWPAGSLEGARILVSYAGFPPMVSIVGSTDLTFEGLVFEGARYDLVDISGTSAGVVIRDSRLLCTGRRAVRIATTIGAGRAGKENGLYRCEIGQAAATGVTVMGGDFSNLAGSGNFVEQCDVHHFGRRKLSDPGIDAFDGVGHRIRHNEIHSGPYQGLRIRTAESLFEYNEIYDVVRWSGDMSAIYTGRSWIQRGNVLRFNYIHDLFSYNGGLKVTGIYLDDTASGSIIFGNVLNRVQDRPSFNNGGRDNLWENNLILNSGIGHRGSTIGIDRVSSDMLDEMLEVGYRKPPWSEAYPELAVIPDDYSLWTDDTKRPYGTVFSRNVLWNNTENYSELNGAFSYYAEMRDNLVSQSLALGEELFENPEADDFRLRPDGPAFDIPGFVDVPFSLMGREPASVRSWPVFDDDIPGQLRIAAYLCGAPSGASVRFYYGTVDSGVDPEAWTYATTAQTIDADGFVSARIDLAGNEVFVGRWMATSLESGLSVWSDGLTMISGDGSGVQAIRLREFEFRDNEVEFTFEGLDPKTDYQLERSVDLEPFVPVEGSVHVHSGSMGVFTGEFDGTEGKAVFFRISIVR